MILVIQEITTWWTKRSRSGDAAARRAATPRALPLPELPTAGGPILIHHRVTFHEERGFAPEGEPLEVRPVSPRQTVEAGCATIRFLGDGAEAVWAWRFSCGAPRRSEHPRKVLTLGPGEWGRIQWNGRSSSLAGMAGWRYRLQLVNVALLDEPLAVPFRGEPTKEFSALADLR